MLRARAWHLLPIEMNDAKTTDLRPPKTLKQTLETRTTQLVLMLEDHLKCRFDDAAISLVHDEMYSLQCDAIAFRVRNGDPTCTSTTH